MKVDVYLDKTMNGMLGFSNAKTPSRSDLIHFATVETSSYNIEDALDEAYEKTQSPNALRIVEGLTLHKTSIRVRSTSVGDIMASNGAYYQVTSHGFERVNL